LKFWKNPRGALTAGSLSGEKGAQECLGTEKGRPAGGAGKWPVGNDQGPRQVIVASPQGGES